MIRAEIQQIQYCLEDYFFVETENDIMNGGIGDYIYHRYMGLFFV